MAVINIIDRSSYRRQSVSAGPTNTFHSLHFPLLLFRLQSPRQCVCVYVPCDASVVPPDTQQGFFPFHKFLVGATSEVAPICLRRITNGAYLAEMFTVGYLQHLASMLPPWKSCPLWFFTFGLLRPRCGPGPCVYAARGDAWRQTSTPHPNNGPLLRLPPLRWLIIRIVSEGKWGRNARRKALRGPQSKLPGLHSYFSGSPPRPVSKQSKEDEGDPFH